MSNPIKSLLPTPLSMHFIADVNCLAKMPLPLFKFLINSALTQKSSFFNAHDQKVLKSILNRQQICPSIGQGSINSLKQIESIAQRVLKLMRTSQLQEIESNLENCQKYLASVLTQNTLIDQNKLTILLEKLANFIHQSLSSQQRQVQTQFGIVEWSLYNLKKANIGLSSRRNNSGLQNNEQRGGEFKSANNNSNLRQINKMYVKVSFDSNFSNSAIQRLIQNQLQPITQRPTQCKIQKTSIKNSQTNNKKTTQKNIIMSLIDFRLFMEQMEKIKNLNP